jgi:1,4-alpha-glucan branching enzyme
VELGQLTPLIEGRHENPFELLGPHRMTAGDQPVTAVRTFQPQSQQVWLVHPDQGQVPMRQVHPAGLFETICTMIEETNPAAYKLRSIDDRGQETESHDPYAFPPLVTDYDLHLMGEGNHWDIYERMGAHLRTVDGITGVNFAVWAPNATGVSVVGDFNQWDARRHSMRKHVPSGVWELFVPGLKEGDLYKFHVRHHGQVVEKSDPYGFAAELPPRTASKVVDLNRYQWGDGEWMDRRANSNQLEKPISIYEVHLGSWRRPGDNPSKWLDYRDLAHQLVEYCQKMNFTHVELMPVSEHPFTPSWGYQTVGYFAATSRYGSPEDLMYFIDHCHKHDIGVIIDWVPAHFPRDAHGLRMFDGTCLYEHADPRQGEHPDWGTLIFNYGRNEVRNFLISNALFWLDKYHIDGLRVDAVASMLYLDYSRKEGEWLPNEYGGRENLAAISFLKLFNEQCHAKHPGALTIAEESTAFGGVSRPTYLGGLGFSLKWNMGWMNDTRKYMGHEPIHRKYHHDEATFSLIYAFTENFCLPLSHDEVVHGKGSLLDQMPGGGDIWQRFANLRLLYGYMWTHPGKKLLFMGGEFGQWHEWTEANSLQWHLLQWDPHQGMQRWVADLNRIYCHEKALHEVDFDHHGFEWIDCHNWEESLLTYVRRAKDPNDFVVIANNFTPVPRTSHRMGVPEKCYYREILNSDSQYYGGSNVGNYPGAMADDIPWNGRPYSIPVKLPPLGVVVFKPERG